MIKNFKTWIKSAGIRALKTFAQTFVATIGTGAAVLGDVNWWMVLSSAALAAILSLMTSLAGLPEVKYEVEMEQAKNEEIEEIKVIGFGGDHPEENKKVEAVTKDSDDATKE